MAAVSEPDAGHGAGFPRNAVLGTSQLSFGVGQLTEAVRENSRLLRQESSLNAHADAVHNSRFGSNPEARKQWDDRVAARAEYNARSHIKRQRDADSQSAWHAASRQSMRDQLAASASANAAPPNLSFPRNNGGYTGGVPSRPYSLGGNTTAPPWMATGPTPPGAYSNYGPGGGMSLPWQNPGGWAGASNGSSQNGPPRPPAMTGLGIGGMGGTAPPPVPPGGGGSAPGMGAAFGKMKTFASQNKGMIGIGLAAGAVNALGSGLQNYSTRMLNTNYDQFGNLVVLRNGGYAGQTYGDASSRGIDKLRASRFIATSPADLINGGAQILANSSNQTFGQNLTNAGVSAYLTPGMGLGQAAANQQQEGTNQANIASQMMFGVGTRQRGGGQLSEVGLANAALNATRGGQGMNGMTPDKLAAMLQQGGSLRTNLNTYAQNAGLGPEAVDSLANILTAQTAYKNKYGSVDGFESTIEAASKGPGAARQKLKGTGIGESVEQSILNRQGAKIDRDMNSQSSYIDTLKKTNDLLEGLNDNLTSLMKRTGADKALGWLGGGNAGSGGRGSAAMKYGASGAVLGSFFGPGGMLLGGAAGGLYGFVSGGAEKAVSGSDPKQNATPSPTSGAANTAASFAEAQVGKPYVTGATGPNAYDCSGLMQAAFKSAGVSIPRVSSTQSQFGKAVPLDQIAPGDLIFPKGYDGLNGAPSGLPGHVMMALSGGPTVSVVQAGSPKTGVYNSSIGVGSIESARRMTDGVGTLSPTLSTTATGGSKTNTSTAAGTSQKTGGGASGMNEIDVLGSVLGRAAFQLAGSTPSSAQKTGSGSVNGTANARPGYSKGAYSIDGDQISDLHDGEMVLDAKLSRSVRAALMADVPRHSAATSGGVTLNFSSGSIAVSVAGSMTGASASAAARQIVDAISADNRIQQIGVGL